MMTESETCGAGPMTASQVALDAIEMVPIDDLAFSTLYVASEAVWEAHEPLREVISAMIPEMRGIADDVEGEAGIWISEVTADQIGEAAQALHAIAAECRRMADEFAVERAAGNVSPAMPGEARRAARVATVAALVCEAML